jgi:hypothetical protein
MGQGSMAKLALSSKVVVKPEQKASAHTPVGNVAASLGSSAGDSPASTPSSAAATDTTGSSPLASIPSSTAARDTSSPLATTPSSTAAKDTSSPLVDSGATESATVPQAQVTMPALSTALPAQSTAARLHSVTRTASAGLVAMLADSEPDLEQFDPYTSQPIPYAGLNSKQWELAQQIHEYRAATTVAGQQAALQQIRNALLARGGKAQLPRPQIEVPQACWVRWNGKGCSSADNAADATCKYCMLPVHPACSRAAGAASPHVLCEQCLKQRAQLHSKLMREQPKAAEKFTVEYTSEFEA